MKLASKDPITLALSKAANNTTGIVSMKPKEDPWLDGATLYWTTIINIVDERCSVDRQSFLRTVISSDNRVIQAIVSGHNVTDYTMHLGVLYWLRNRNYDKSVMMEVERAFAKCKASRYTPTNKAW